LHIGKNGNSFQKAPPQGYGAQQSGLTPQNLKEQKSTRPDDNTALWRIFALKSAKVSPIFVSGEKPAPFLNSRTLL